MNPNFIIPEIIDIKIKKEEKTEFNEYIKRVITLYDESPRLLRKFGFDISNGKVEERINIDYKNKILTSDAKNRTLFSFISVTTKDYIVEEDENIIWKSYINIWCLIPGGSAIANGRYEYFKELEKDIIDTYLLKNTS